ncbi:rho-related GTP-binding protein RhoU-like isoform X2 [Rhipicephalus microplus]|uniref:rho-related GTP-binding protein RhoU-like isoform X2 n=1 Tax=Rhipicephalus microplus TaxID=6941 RepID=UPI003F6A9522
MHGDLLPSGDLLKHGDLLPSGHLLKHGDLLPSGDLLKHGDLLPFFDDFDSLRPLCYPNAAVLLLCFSVVCPTSFQNASQKWLPELRRHCPDAPIVLVGTQCDLRTDVKVLIELARYGEEPVPESAARHAAHRMGALAYVECSALTQKNLKEVFDTAIVAALRRNSPGLVGKGFNLLPSRSSPGSRNGTGQFGNGFVPFPRRRAVSLDRRGARDYEGKKTGWKKLCCFI